MNFQKMTLALVATLVLVAGIVASPVTAQAQDDQYLELMRQDLRTNKTAIMTEAMALTSQQSDNFWPIYREYQNKLSAIGDRRLALIKSYAENYENMTTEKSQELMKSWFKQQKDRLSLLEKTARKVAKATDPVLAARFVQVENGLNTVIDLQVAAELPLFMHGPDEGHDEGHGGGHGH